jgi:TolA-binding protein
MLKKHALGTLLLCCTAPVFANIPIESRGLSQNSASYAPNNTQAAISTGSGETVTTNLNWQLMQKNQQLENDIRTLRGKIEEHDNEIEKLKNELNNRYADLDQRLETLQQKVEPSEESTTPEEDNQQGTAPSTNNSTLKVAPVTNTPSPAPTIKTSSVVVPAKPTTAPVATAKSTVPAVKSDELDKAAYTVALDAYKQGGAKKAIAPMQNFIKNNPNSVYISNAHFWLAEFNVAIEPSNFAEAKRNYTIVANQYPNSARASRALYQLYSIAKDVDHNTAQATQYKQKLLKTYPQSEEAKYFK